jgi:SAM-dependent methyltransferase
LASLRRLVSSRPAGGVRLSIRFPGDTSGHFPTYSDIVKYVEDLESRAYPLGETGPATELFAPKLASVWGDYVGVQQRLDANGPVRSFLRSVVGDRRYVLDAASGTGCESVALLKEGFSVQSNEIDAVLASEAADLASAHKVSLNLTRYLWERLPEAIQGNFKFDAVLALGNSLSLVPYAGRRKACVEAFWEVLSPGGILVIDERNYEQILRNAREIEEDPLERFGPARSGDVMFRGARIRAYPSSISPERILWDFFLNVPPPRTSAELAQKRLGTPPLELYPFGYGELFELLRDVGFDEIDVYVDLAARYHGMPTRDDSAGGDFLTYVAVKRRD